MKNTKKWNAILRMAGFIAIVAMIGFSMAGCDTDGDGGSGGNNDPKTIVITGIPAEVTNINLILFKKGNMMSSADGSGTVSNGTVTIALSGTGSNTGPWTGNGNFTISIDANGTYYYYTAGAAFISEAESPEYNITSAISTIPWNQFAPTGW